MNTETQNADDLINQLCGDLDSVKKRCPYRHVSLWFVLSVAYIIGVIAYSGLKVDLNDHLMSAPFIFEMGMAVAILISAAFASSWLSFPDGLQRDWMKTIAVTLFGGFLLWIFANGIEEGGFGFSSQFLLTSCSRGLFIDFIPFSALIFITAKGNTTQPYWAMTMNVLAVSALGWIGLRLTCPMYDSMSFGFTHYLLPFSILGVGFGFFARKLFKW